jgi:hypothetical protein
MPHFSFSPGDLVKAANFFYGIVLGEYKVKGFNCLRIYWFMDTRIRKDNNDWPRIPQIVDVWNKDTIEKLEVIS